MESLFDTEAGVKASRFYVLLANNSETAGWHAKSLTKPQRVIIIVRFKKLAIRSNIDGCCRV